MPSSVALWHQVLTVYVYPSCNNCYQLCVHLLTHLHHPL